MQTPFEEPPASRGQAGLQQLLVFGEPPRVAKLAQPPPTAAFTLTLPAAALQWLGLASVAVGILGLATAPNAIRMVLRKRARGGGAATRSRSATPPQPARAPGCAPAG